MKRTLVFLVILGVIVSSLFAKPAMASNAAWPKDGGIDCQTAWAAIKNDWGTHIARDWSGWVTIGGQPIVSESGTVNWGEWAITASPMPAGTSGMVQAFVEISDASGKVLDSNLVSQQVNCPADTPTPTSTPTDTPIPSDTPTATKTPGNANGSVVVTTCAEGNGNGSANVTINNGYIIIHTSQYGDVEVDQSGPVYLPEGAYSWNGYANGGFNWSGPSSGNFTIDGCSTATPTATDTRVADTLTPTPTISKTPVSSPTPSLTVTSTGPQPSPTKTARPTRTPSRTSTKKPTRTPKASPTSTKTPGPTSKPGVITTPECDQHECFGPIGIWENIKGQILTSSNQLYGPLPQSMEVIFFEDDVCRWTGKKCESLVKIVNIKVRAPQSIFTIDLNGPHFVPDTTLGADNANWYTIRVQLAVPGVQPVYSGVVMLDSFHFNLLDETLQKHWREINGIAPYKYSSCSVAPDFGDTKIENGVLMLGRFPGMVPEDVSHFLQLNSISKEDADNYAFDTWKNLKYGEYAPLPSSFVPVMP